MPEASVDNRNPTRAQVLEQIAKQLSMPTKTISGRTRLFIKYQGQQFEVIVEKKS